MRERLCLCANRYLFAHGSRTGGVHLRGVLYMHTWLNKKNPKSEWCREALKSASKQQLVLLALAAGGLSPLRLS